MNNISSTNNGFTLIELIIVIAMIGILSVMVVPKWTTTSMGLNYESRRVLNDIRYAQALSMVTGQRYRWVRGSATTYSITNQAGTAVMLPSGTTTYTLQGGVTIGTLTNLPNNLIAFDAVGAPYTDTATPGTALVSTATIPLTVGGVSRSVQITPQTGYGVLS